MSLTGKSERDRDDEHREKRRGNEMGGYERSRVEQTGEQQRDEEEEEEED